MFALALPRLYIRRLLHRFRGAPSRREPNLEFLISQNIHCFGNTVNMKYYSIVTIHLYNIARAP